MYKKYTNLNIAIQFFYYLGCVVSLYVFVYYHLKIFSLYNFEREELSKAKLNLKQIVSNTSNNYFITKIHKFLSKLMLIPKKIIQNN